ncbi:bifunctional ornithine acetyltransferase/N-acetylglutamate synthase [Microaceticoccus formicicus]|uniref:bifunctional ornithine acetyltransferase/N-acetylglutamate synthase n=1 Tax=Microaceticoccus formicicus TaxID=3118105 RepID=UPI003CCFFB78|nr:bifunctional ornithine acetyltransferase/N-acetylglutamate synthase [Peptoniphilaceae bacterium AMB_02]
MKVLEGNITAPKGFLASAIGVDLKGSGKEKEDIMVVYSEVPAKAAGTFTKNLVKSGTVTYCMENIKNENARAFLGLSGVANTAVKDALEKADMMCSLAADFLNIDKSEVLPACTGRIGKIVDIERIKSGFDKMKAPDKNSSDAVSRAIMTTDSFPKKITVQEEIGGSTVTISCIGKGSGMIHPNMGTTINFATTDIAISKELLQEALSSAIDETFNMLSIDGDMSTNDTFLIMTSGLAGNEEIVSKNEDYELFKNALTEATRVIAKLIASDGEGASKLLISKIEGARTREDARILAKSVITSPRYKAAVNKFDDYAARILANMGYSGGMFDYLKATISYRWGEYDKVMYDRGESYGLSDEEKQSMLDIEELIIFVDLHEGEFSSEAYGCDLGCEYINGLVEYK